MKVHSLKKNINLKKIFLLFTFDYLDYPKKIFHNKKANNLTVDSANLNEICEYCIVIGDTSLCKISAQ